MQLANQVHRQLLMSPQGIVKRGLVAEYRFDDWRNLLKWSEDLSNAAWVKEAGVVVTGGFADPVGGNTAYKVDFPDGLKGLYQLGLTDSDLAKLLTASIFVKSDTSTQIDLYINGSWAGPTTLGVTTVWARISATPVRTTATAYLGIRSATVGVQSIYIWGAHLQLASQANQSYQLTTDGQTLTDYKGGFNGTLGSTAAADANDPTPDGQGLSFDGGDYVNCGNVYNPGMDNFTLIAVVKTSSATTQVAIGKGLSGANPLYTLGVWSTGQILASVEDGSGHAVDGTADGDTVADGNVHFIAAIIDRAGRKMSRYHGVRQTGTEDNISAVTGSISPTTANLTIGAFNNGASALLVGVEYYALLYNVDLTPKEIKQNYKAIQRYLAERGIRLS